MPSTSPIRATQRRPAVAWQAMGWQVRNRREFRWRSSHRPRSRARWRVRSVFRRAYGPRLRADRAESAEALALVELHLRNLDIACRVVIDDDQPSHKLV